MAIDEHTRQRLLERFTEFLGPDLAEAYMELHPPIDWSHLATKSDIERLEAEIALCAKKSDLDRFATKDDLAPLATRAEVSSEIRAAAAEVREHCERVVREAITSQTRWFIGAVAILALTMVGTNITLVSALA